MPYDLLLLCTGKQVPGLAGSQDYGFSGHDIGKLIKNLHSNPDSQAFIYGSRVDTLAIIQRLHANDILASRITLGLDKTIADLFDIGANDDRKISEKAPEFEILANFVQEHLENLGNFSTKSTKIHLTYSL